MCLLKVKHKGWSHEAKLEGIFFLKSSSKRICHPSTHTALGMSFYTGAEVWLFLQHSCVQVLARWVDLPVYHTSLFYFKQAVARASDGSP